MDFHDFVRRTLTIVAIIATVIIVIVAVWELSSILLITFTCWVLSVGINALIMKLQMRGVSRTVGTLVVFAGLFLFIGLIFSLVLPPFITQITSLVNSLPNAIESLVQEYNRLRQTNAVLENLPEIDFDAFLASLESSAFEEIFGEGGAAIDLGSIAGSAIPILSGIGSFVGTLLANLTIIFLITGYLVADPLVYYRPIVALVPKDQEARTVELLEDIQKTILAWMGALSISITVTSVAVTLVMGVILDIPNPIALGVIAGLGTLIPNVGYYIGLIPIIIFTAAADPLKVIPAALLYWLINEAEGKLVAPAVIKRELNIPAGVVIPFQLIAASVLGFFGILLAVPILAILVTIIRELYVVDVLHKDDHHPILRQALDGDLYLEQSALDADNKRKPDQPTPPTTAPARTD